MSSSTKFPENLRIGFIGAGRMAHALTKGFIKSGLINPKNVIASDTGSASDNFKKIQARGVKCTTDNKEVVEASQVIFISTKPHQVYSVLKEIAPVLGDGKLIISIAAGITVGFIENLTPSCTRVIRVMPNTPCLVLCGATVFTRGKKATADDAAIVRALLESAGICEEVPERMIDAVTGLSGSGPAYMYMAVEAMADGGVKMGLPRDLAVKLAAQTMMGSAKMVLESGYHSAALKDEVCSPAGTTISGVHALEERGFRAALINAVEVATKKAKELGEKSKSGN